MWKAIIRDLGAVCRSRWIAILVFVFALACRLVDFNATSITYDESVGKDSGPWWKLVRSGDFSSEEWGYGRPQFVIMRWFYGVFPEAVFGDNPSDPYDLKGARLVGAVLASALVVGVYFLGRQFGGRGVGIIAALAFSLFPAVLGHDRLASHDLPARLASLVALAFMARHLGHERRRDWFWSAFWAGVSFAAYFRVGVQTILITQTALGFRWLVGKGWRKPEALLTLVGFGMVALVIGFLVFILTWPYAWSRPFLAIAEVFGSPLKISQAGANVEWFFGVIRPLPPWYYAAAYVFMMPTLLLLAHLVGVVRTWDEARRAKAPILLWLAILLPLGMGAVSFRAALNHYLLVCFPAVCVLAALGVQACAERLSRWRGRASSWRMGLCVAMIGSQAVTALRIHPYHLEFFNALVGGTRSVARNHTFMTGWYGEGIRPLFDYVNRHAPSNALVSCRLAAWPGLADLKQNLREDLGIQGVSAINPLGADYLLCVGIESCDQFYRYTPDPKRYEKVFDVLALGGSIGEVWKQRPSRPDDSLVYADDFTTPQISHFAAGSQNLGFNPFSDGKLFPVRTGQPGGILLRIPASLLGKSVTVQVQADVQALGGVAWIQCGSAPTNRITVAQCQSFAGRLESARIVRPGKADLWIFLEIQTTKTWDQDARTFWKYDWFDTLYVRAWPK